TVSDTAIYRNDHIPTEETGGLSVAAADLKLPEAVGATLAKGRWLNPATARYPATVLGAATATQLGIDRVGSQVWLGGGWASAAAGAGWGAGAAGSAGPASWRRCRGRPSWPGPR